MKPALRRSAIAIVCFLVLLGGLAAWWFLPGRRAEVHLAPSSSEAVSRSAFPLDPFFRQADPKWGTEKIGGSGEPLRFVGCTISCLSMAMAQHGIDMNPSELNRKLKEVDGYTGRGWIKWEAIKTVSGERVRIDLPQDPTHEVINEALAIGDPVLVKVVLRSGMHHWVLLVGRDENEYLMKDPLKNGKNLEFLSSLSSNILAVRIMRKI